jgi:hypothetical protein
VSPASISSDTRQADAADAPALKASAVLLVGGWLTFWAGAFTPPYRWWFGIPVREFLEMVAANTAAWLFIAAAFAVGVLLTLAGLVLLGGVLRAAGARGATDLGQAAFLFGGALWLASLAFRATATVSAAKETVASGAVPAWFEPLRAWSGALFAIYMVLAYLAIAAYGRALLRTRLVPRWLARAHLIFGLAGALGFLVRVPVFAPPLMIHLPLGVLGLVLLRARFAGRPAFAPSPGG